MVACLLAHKVHALPRRRYLSLETSEFMAAGGGGTSGRGTHARMDARRMRAAPRFWDGFAPCLVGYTRTYCLGVATNGE